MVLHLAEQLEVPLRDRNQLLLAAGYAPRSASAPLDEPEMAPVREALELVLRGHEPYPAVVVDRWWDLVAANGGIALLTEGVAPELLAPPVNVLRVALHPDGMAPRIVNLAEWRAHLLDRLRRQVVGDRRRRAGRALRGAQRLPRRRRTPAPGTRGGEVVRAAACSAPATRAAFFSTISTFGTAVDITLAELAIESFFPADAATAQALRDA